MSIPGLTKVTQAVDTAIKNVHEAMSLFQPKKNVSQTINPPKVFHEGLASLSDLPPAQLEKYAQAIASPVLPRARLERNDARVDRAPYALGGYRPLLHDTVQLNGLEKLHEVLRNTKNKQNQDAHYQLTAQLMHKTGWSAERLLRTREPVPTQIEGFPLSRQTLLGEGTHLLIVNKATYGEDVAHAVPISSEALSALQNDLWQSIRNRSAAAYRDELRSLPD